jgi:Zn-dependent protease with chaperone function
VFHLPAILLALALAGWAESHPRSVPLGPWGCLFALAALVALSALPHLLARLLLGRSRGPGPALWRGLVWCLALSGHALLLFALDWPGCLRELGLPADTLASWPRAEALLLLLPYGLLALVAIDAGTRWSLPPGPSRRALRRFHGRQLLVGFSALVLAVLLCLPLWWQRPLRVWVDESEPAAALFTLYLAAAFAALFPFLLRFGLGLKPLPPSPLRCAFERLVERAGFRPVALRIWPTGGWLANAAIVGFVPGLRLVMLTDGLLMSLKREELLAVLAHELGHARRHHVLLYAAFTLGWLGLWPGLLQLAEGLGATVSMGQELGLLLSLVLGWLLLFGMLSRRAELDADLAALELIGSSAPLEAALEGVSGPRVRRRRSWRHFTAAQRGLFLRAAAADPGVGQRLRRGLARWARWAAGLVLLALGLVAWSWTNSAAEAELWVHLRLGRFAEAQGLLERLPEPPADERLLAWAELGQAARAAGHLDSPEALLGASRGAFLAQDFELALRYAELGRLLDWEPLSSAQRVLEDWLSAREPGPGAAPLSSPAADAEPGGEPSTALGHPGAGQLEWPALAPAPRPVVGSDPRSLRAP